MAVRMRWLGTACFEILLPNGKTMVIDPFLDESASAPLSCDQLTKCDYIFITHGHYDHLLDAGKLAKRFSPEIYCSKTTKASLINHLSVPAERIRIVTAGGRFLLGDMVVDILPGVHVDFETEFKRLTQMSLPDFIEQSKDPETAIKKGLELTTGSDNIPDNFFQWMADFPGGEQLNFVFSTPGAPIIYMAGTLPDPAVIEAAEKIHADITLLQVLPGEIFKGKEQNTAALAKASGCKIVIPQHHDPLFEGGHQTDLSKLEKLLDSSSGPRLKELTHGRWYTFNCP